MSTYSAKAAASSNDTDPTHPDGKDWGEGWDFPPSGGSDGPWPPGWPPDGASGTRWLGFPSSPGTIYSDDGGTTWNETTTSYSGTPYWLAGGKNLLYASSGSAVYLSVDDGDTWETRSSTPATFSWGALVNTTRLVAGTSTTSGYTYYSDDGGVTWTGPTAVVQAGDFDHPEYGLTSVGAVLASGNILMGVHQAFGAKVVFYISTDNGVSYSKLSTNTDLSTIYAIKGSDNGRVVAVGNPNSGKCGLQVSTTSGLTWTGNALTTDIEGDALGAYSNTMLALCYTATSPYYHSFYSTDGGATWATGDTGVPFERGSSGYDNQIAIASDNTTAIGTPSDGIYMAEGLTGFAKVSNNSDSAVYVLE